MTTKRIAAKPEVVVDSDAQERIERRHFEANMSRLYELITEMFPGTTEIRVLVREDPEEENVERIVVELENEMEFVEFMSTQHKLIDILFLDGEAFPSFLTIIKW